MCREFFTAVCVSEQITEKKMSTAVKKGLMSLWLRDCTVRLRLSYFFFFFFFKTDENNTCCFSYFFDRVRDIFSRDGSNADMFLKKKSPNDDID
jgi:hypothetical protein